MARLLKGDKMVDPPRGRRLSFKTKASNERRSAVRAVRVTVAASSVADIASKFNAVVVEDELKARAILKKKVSLGPSGSVRAAVQKFEGLQCSKTVLVRKNSVQQVVQKPTEERTIKTDAIVKPCIQPKPKTIDRKSHGRYVRKDLKELLGKEKRFSLPKTLLLDEVFNESAEKDLQTNPTPKKFLANDETDNRLEVPSILLTEPDKLKDEDKVPLLPNPSSLHSSNSTYVKAIENELTTTNNIHMKSTSSAPIRPSTLHLNTKNVLNDSVPEKLSSLTINVETKNIFNSAIKDNEQIYGNQDIIKNNEEEMKKKQVELSNPTSIIRPNSSFLWGVKAPGEVTPIEASEILEKVHEVQPKFKESPADDVKDIDAKDIIENKENLEKLETPIVRTVDKKGYGKINVPVQGNSSSLYRNILKQALIGEIKENMEKSKTKEEETIKSININEIEKNLVNEESIASSQTILSDRGYEIIDQAYELIGFENSYAEIGGSTNENDDVIYDDVSTIQGERIYESIYSGSVQQLRQTNDSDSSCDLQSNSLYELRPPSQASSGTVQVKVHRQVSSGASVH